MTKQKQFEIEHSIVDRFVRVCGHSKFVLDDPNAGRKTDTGADVLVTLENRRYGFQVTEYHADEGTNSISKGSALRREEASQKNNKHPYFMWGNSYAIPALAYRIEEKSKKKCSLTDFDEAILLIASSIPQQGAIASTFLLDAWLDISEMNATLSQILQRTDYSSAYLYNMVGIGGSTVYEWTREMGWKKLCGAAIN